MRVLNRGGAGNADVLLVRTGDARRVVVKDYGQRSLLVRRLLAPWLLRHELAMLERLEGLPGVPRPLGRVGRHALCMEYVDGAPLQRRQHRASLPAPFFDALEGILAGIALRGVVHLDLKSPSNVLCSDTRAPAVVDLSAALRLPLPATWLERIEHRALTKLRARFQSEGFPVEFSQAASSYSHVAVGRGRLRLRYRDCGRDDDPVPALLLPEVGVTVAHFAPLLEAAASCGRRALAVDLPGCGGSGRPLVQGGVPAAARRMLAFLDALRVRRADLFGQLWGGLVALELAALAPERVRCVVTLDTPAPALRGTLLHRWELAKQGGRKLQHALLAEIPPDLPAAEREQVEWLIQGRSGRAARRAYRRLAASRRTHAAPTLSGLRLPRQPWLSLSSSSEDTCGTPAAARSEAWSAPLGEPQRFWKALAELAAAS